MPPHSSPPTARPGIWGMVAVVFGLVLGCYWPALRGGLVWDDPAHVTAPELRSVAGLGRIWTDVRATQQYYPILHSAFWIEHRLWGDATLGYHVVNVLLHAASCCLLALFLRRLWRGSGVPAGAEWLAALLFVVHPVCVESVAWISEQKNTLSLLFYLLAALVYLDFVDERKPAAYACALFFFLLALATKSVTATLPGALLVVLWWRQGRLEWKRDVTPLLPWLVIGAGAGLFTVWVERSVVGAVGAVYDLSLLQRALLAGRAIWFYLGKLVWSADLIFVYPRWDVPVAGAAWAVSLLAAISVTAILWRLRRRSRGPLAGWLFFVGTLFPALGFFNIFPFVYSYVADHFQYVPMLGVIVPVAAGLARLAAGSAPTLRLAARGAALLLVAGLAVLSNRQSALYRSGETLYRATLEKNPACWMAHNNLATLLSRQPGHELEAIAHYESALPGNPHRSEVEYNLAKLLARLPGRTAEAQTHYEHALALDPSLAGAHNDLAALLASRPGHEAEVIAHYEAALRLDPSLMDTRFNLASHLARQSSRQPEAISHLEQVLRANPDDAEAHYVLAAVLADQHRLDEAIAHCKQALRLKPDYVAAHAMLDSLRRLRAQ